MKSILRVLTISSMGIVAACTTANQEKVAQLYPVSYESFSGWKQENFPQLISIFSQNCQYLMKLPRNTNLGGEAGIFGGKVQDWYNSCQIAQRIPQNQTLVIKQFFETWFQPYQYSVSTNYGKITGYYEPEFQGSEKRWGPYQTPVYARPSDLVSQPTNDGKVVSGFWNAGRITPYYTRAQINAGILSGKGLELAWLTNPADLFIMQIQGSGRIILPDGRMIRLAYAGKNGQPYVPLGRVMVQQGLIAPHDVNLYTMRAWLQKHPQQAKNLMDQNPNYVFFRHLEESNNNQGPVGALGIPLTAGRSVAVDKKWIPLGTPLWVETTLPTQPNGLRRPWQHMVFAQDLGGDIQGVNRLDLFTGWGQIAEWYAGLMKEKGKIYILLPRQPVNSTGKTDALVLPPVH